jgi:hypothetical protein
MPVPVPPGIRVARLARVVWCACLGRHRMIENFAKIERHRAELLQIVGRRVERCPRETQLMRTMCSGASTTR